MANWLDGWDNEQLKLMQERDAEVGIVLQWFTEGRARPSIAELLTHGTGV
jgi:hypothetical protein